MELEILKNEEKRMNMILFREGCDRSVDGGGECVDQSV